MKLDKKILGMPKGSLGDLTFKTRKGKTYIATRPKKVIRTDPNSLEAKGKFSFASGLFSAMYKVHIFKTIWDMSEIPGENGYKKMFINYNRISKDRDLSSVLLLPVEAGFTVNFISAEFSGDNLKIITAPLGADSAISTDQKISAQGVIVQKDPGEPERKQYSFLPYASDSIIQDGNDNLVFDLSMTTGGNLLPSYESRYFFFNLVTKDKQGIPKNSSAAIIVEV
jgi:hypothetical protein